MKVCPGSRLVSTKQKPCACTQGDGYACTYTCVWHNDRQRCYPKCQNGTYARYDCGCVRYGTEIAEFTVYGDYCSAYGGVSHGCGTEGAFAVTTTCACNMQGDPCPSGYICNQNYCYLPCPLGPVDTQCFCGTEICSRGRACTAFDDSPASSGMSAGVVCLSVTEYREGTSSGVQAYYCGGLCLSSRNSCEASECVCQKNGLGVCQTKDDPCGQGYRFDGQNCIDQSEQIVVESAKFPSLTDELVSARCGAHNNAVIWPGQVCLKVQNGWRLLPRCAYYFESEQDCACAGSDGKLVAVARGAVCSASGGFSCQGGSCLAKFACELAACLECSEDGTECVACDTAISRKGKKDCLPILPAYCEKATFSASQDAVECLQCAEGAVLYRTECYLHGGCDILACVQCGTSGDECALCDEKVSVLQHGECVAREISNCKVGVISADGKNVVCYKCENSYALVENQCVFDEQSAKRYRAWLIAGITLAVALGATGISLAAFFRVKAKAQEDSLRRLQARGDNVRRTYRLRAIRRSADAALQTISM